MPNTLLFNSLADDVTPMMFSSRAHVWSVQDQGFTGYIHANIMSLDIIIAVTNVSVTHIQDFTLSKRKI